LHDATPSHFSTTLIVMGRSQHIYYAIHAISLLKIIYSDINYVNFCFGMDAVNSIILLKFDWNPVTVHLTVSVQDEINWESKRPYALVLSLQHNLI